MSIRGVLRKIGKTLRYSWNMAVNGQFRAEMIAWARRAKACPACIPGQTEFCDRHDDAAEYIFKKHGLLPEDERDGA